MKMTVWTDRRPQKYFELIKSKQFITVSLLIKFTVTKVLRNGACNFKIGLQSRADIFKNFATVYHLFRPINLNQLQTTTISHAPTVCFVLVGSSGVRLIGLLIY